MEVPILIALLLVSPVIILPVLFVWYMNLGGVYSAFRKAWGRRGRQSSPGGNIEADRKRVLLNNLQTREE